MLDRLLDKSDARKALGGIGNTKLYQLLNSGEIQGVKIGKRLMITPQSIAHYIERLPSYKPQGEEE